MTTTAPTILCKNCKFCKDRSFDFATCRHPDIAKVTINTVTGKKSWQAVYAQYENKGDCKLFERRRSMMPYMQTAACLAILIGTYFVLGAGE